MSRKVTVTRISKVDGSETTRTGNFNDGDVLVLQGDIALKYRENVSRNFVATEFSNVVVAHGESKNTHVMEALDRKQALQWLHDATEKPNRLTEFSYGRLQPGTSMSFMIPEGGTYFKHEEHDDYIIHDSVNIDAVRQFETRGQTQQNVWD